MSLSKSESSADPIISFDLMFDAALASKQRRRERRKRCKQICQTFSPSSIHSCTGHQTSNGNDKMGTDEKTYGDCGERFFLGRESGWDVDKVTLLMLFNFHQAFQLVDNTYTYLSSFQACIPVFEGLLEVDTYRSLIDTSTGVIENINIRSPTASIEDSFRC